MIKSIYTQTLNAISQGIIITDPNQPDNPIIYCNNAIQQMTGYREDELLGRNCRFLQNDDRDQEGLVVVRRSIREARECQVVVRNYKKDGVLFWNRLKISPVHDENGNLINFIGVQSDISEQRRSETELLRSETKFQSLAESADDAIIIADKNRNIVSWNNAGEKIFGYSKREILGKPLTTVIPDYYRSKRLQPVRRQAKKGETRSTGKIIELRGVRKGSVAFPIELARAAWTVDGQRYSGAIVRDITTRLQREAKIRQQAALLHVANEAVFVQDLTDRIVYYNRSARAAFGWKFANNPKKRFTELFDESSATTLEHAKRIIVDERTWSGELHHTDMDGNLRVFASRWTLMDDDKGEPQSILVINTDITEKKRMEEQLLRAQRTESIGALAEGIAHDLNNVFAPILMEVQFLQMKSANTDFSDHFARIESSVNRGRELVRQIRNFSRGFKGERIIVEVQAVIEDVIKMVDKTLPKSIEIDVAIPDGLWSVIGDPIQLRQVVLNLCINARDAIGEQDKQGVVSISAENAVVDKPMPAAILNSANGRYVIISVRDNGAGIPKNALEKIFEPNFTTKDETRGSGLGLAITMDIVNKHHGFIDVKSRVAEGTTFQVYLPAGHGAEEESMVTDSQLPRGNGECILAVDDESVICEIIAEILEDSGYRVVTAGNGREALEKYKQIGESIDVIISNVEMPVLDGISLIRAVRSSDPDIKIIVMSGAASETDITRRLDCGISAFIRKPFNSGELLTSVRAVLEPQIGSRQV